MEVLPKSWVVRKALSLLIWNYPLGFHSSVRPFGTWSFKESMEDLQVGKGC